MTKGLVYYSDNRGDPLILETVRKQLRHVSNGYQLVSAVLAPGVAHFGDIQIVLPLERSRLAMFKQILAGLEALSTDVAFLVEHDCLYTASHFAFDPPRRDRYYYDTNWYRVDAHTGRAVTYLANQVSGLCADRALLLDHYRRRVAQVERDGYDHRLGYEPGNHPPPRGLDAIPAERYRAAEPYIDIRHGCNLTASRWDPAQFRDKSTCTEWQEVDAIPGWGSPKGRFREWLTEIGAQA
jgi:hypothetical protein